MGRRAPGAGPRRVLSCDARPLQAHAVPLVDTFDTVINRAVGALDAVKGNGAGSPPPGAVRSVNPSKPPNLAYTTVHSIIFKGKALPLRLEIEGF